AFPPTRPEADMRKALSILIIMIATLQARQYAAQNKAEDGLSERLNEARKLLEDAIVQSEKQLEHEQCSMLFGPDALQSLHTTDFRILSLGGPVLREGHLVVTGARTIANHKMVLINLDGPFVTPKILIGGKYEYFVGVQPRRRSVSLSDAQLRVLIILHELGHV